MWLQEKGVTFPFTTGKFGNCIVNIHILVLVYVEYCQRGRHLLAHSASKSLFLPLKLRSAAQVDTGNKNDIYCIANWWISIHFIFAFSFCYCG